MAENNADMPRLVIGLGTGRSGTVSLSRLLDAQTGAAVDHELRPLLPWTFDNHAIDARIGELLARPNQLVGDVAYYYLPYVRHILTKHPNTKFVCMRRSRDAVIDSMMRKTRNDHLWMDHDGSEWTLNELWDPTMPSYEPMPKREAIARYWDEYNDQTIALADELGESFAIFDLETTFTNELEVQKLLSHVGIERNAQRVVVDIHENALPPEVVRLLNAVEAEKDRTSAAQHGIERRQRRIAELDAAVTQRDARIAELDAAVTQRDARIAELDAAVTQRDARIAELDAAVAQRDARIGLSE